MYPLVLVAFKTASLVFFSLSLPFVILAGKKFRQNRLEAKIAQRLLFTTAFAMLFVAYENFAQHPSPRVSFVFEILFCAVLVWTVSILGSPFWKKKEKEENTQAASSTTTTGRGAILFTAGSILATLACKVYAVWTVFKAYTIPESACISKRLRSFLESFGLFILMFAISDLIFWSQTYSWGILNLASITYFYSVWKWYSQAY